MKTVVNTTLAPIQVPMPGNKILRIAPKGSGQIRDEAAEFGPLKKMVEAGTITVQDGGERGGVSGGGGVTASAGRPASRGAFRQSRGDR